MKCYVRITALSKIITLLQALMLELQYQTEKMDWIMLSVTEKMDRITTLSTKIKLNCDRKMNCILNCEKH